MSDTDDRGQGKGENGEPLDEPAQLASIDGDKPTVLPVNPLLDPEERRRRDLERRKAANESVKRSYKLNGRKK